MKVAPAYRTISLLEILQKLGIISMNELARLKGNIIDEMMNDE